MTEAPALPWDEHGISVQSRHTDKLPRLDDGLPVLDHREDWKVTGPAEKVEEIAADAGTVAEKIDDGVLFLTFGNAVGQISFPYLGRVKLESGKWDGRSFDCMLDEVARRSAELPYRAGETGAVPYSRVAADSTQILYHSFAYLRYALSDEPDPEERLHRAFDVIQRDPHREWEHKRESVDLGKAQRVDARSLHRIFQGASTYVPAESTQGASSPLAKALGGNLPEEIEERQDRSTVDTPENRFAKAFLDQIKWIIDDVRQRAQTRGRSVLETRVERECEELEKRLRPISRHSLWTDVGQMVQVPSGSTVLQRRRGYRQLYRHYARLRMMTHLPLDEGEATDLLEAKDIAVLYELWTFFRLSSLVEDVLGPPEERLDVERSEWEAGVRTGTTLRWPDGTELRYNPWFSPNSRQDQESYSVPLRPDVALRVPDGPNEGLHLFDAKFRVDKLDEAVPDEEQAKAEEAERAERAGEFKRGDLYKMHTYRDAIPDARSIWILYPGTEARFYSVNGTRWEDDGRSVPSVPLGVGGLPMRPDDKQQVVSARVVRTLLGAESGESQLKLHIA